MTSFASQRSSPPSSPRWDAAPRATLGARGTIGRNPHDATDLEGRETVTSVAMRRYHLTDVRPKRGEAKSLRVTARRDGTEFMSQRRGWTRRGGNASSVAHVYDPHGCYARTAGIKPGLRLPSFKAEESLGSLHGVRVAVVVMHPTRPETLVNTRDPGVTARAVSCWAARAFSCPSVRSFVMDPPGEAFPFESDLAGRSLEICT